MPARMKDIEELVGHGSAEIIVSEVKKMLSGIEERTNSFTEDTFINDCHRQRPGSYSDKWNAAILMALDREFCLGNMKEWVRVQRSGNSMWYAYLPHDVTGTIRRFMECTVGH